MIFPPEVRDPRYLLDGYQIVTRVVVLSFRHFVVNPKEYSFLSYI